MKIDSLEKMYIAELQELASAERQLSECLPRVARAAAHAALRDALFDHQDVATAQVSQLEATLKKHGANPNEHIDQAMQALVYETEKMLPMLKGQRIRDAGLIASIQRLKHYQIAAYGTAAALAGQLKFTDDEKLLHQFVEDEKEGDAILTDLAESEVNPDALAA